MSGYTSHTEIVPQAGDQARETDDSVLISSVEPDVAL
jgi:hypothetical protein